jgi:hypothetical protein
MITYQILELEDERVGYKQRLSNVNDDIVAARKRDTTIRGKNCYIFSW